MPGTYTDRIQLRFEAFHRKHPQVYRMLVNLAREYRDRRQRVGIAHLFEIARYKLFIEEELTYKLNNNFRSRYARLIMRQEPDLKGYFRTRFLRCEDYRYITQGEESS